MKTAHMREYMARYYAVHRDKLLQYARDQYRAKKEAAKAEAEAKAKRREYNRRWRAAHPHYKSRKAMDRAKEQTIAKRVATFTRRAANARSRYPFPPGDEWVRLDFETLWNLCDADHAEYCRRWCLAHPIKISELIKMRRIAAG